MTEGTYTGTQSRKSRKRLIALLILLIVLAGVYTIGWFHLAGRLEARAKADMARLSAQGIGVRCEDITVTERGVPGSLPATLAFTELLGADALGWFDCLGKRFSTRLGIEAARAMKGEVGLTFDMGKASLFSKDTEQRL